MRGGSDRAFLDGGLLDVVATLISQISIALVVMAVSRTHRRTLLNTVQVKCKANAEPRLARAMLSRSLHSPLHLKCNGKGTTIRKGVVRLWPTVKKEN